MRRFKLQMQQLYYQTYQKKVNENTFKIQQLKNYFAFNI